jgi:branched-chain amino acid transport system permease protein
VIMMFRYIKIAFVALLAVLMLSMPFYAPDYETYLVTMVCNYVVVAIGLNILCGLCGQISFGQAGFYAVGAYTCGLLITRYGAPVGLALAAATALSGLVGSLTAFPALRLSGLALAIATFGFAVLVQALIVFFGNITGGVSGLLVPSPEISGNSGADNFYFNFAAALLAFWISRNVDRSKIGRAFRSIRGSEVAARSSGIDVTRYKLLAFGLASGMAGLAGGLYALVTQYISPETFDATLSIYFFAMVIVGGLGSTVGSVLGAAFFILLPEALRDAKDTQMIIFGVVIVLVSVFLPAGLVGVLARAKPIFGRLFARGARSMPPTQPSESAGEN